MVQYIGVCSCLPLGGDVALSFTHVLKYSFDLEVCNSVQRGTNFRFGIQEWAGISDRYVCGRIEMTRGSHKNN